MNVTHSCPAATLWSMSIASQPAGACQSIQRPAAQALQMRVQDALHPVVHDTGQLWHLKGNAPSAAQADQWHAPQRGVHLGHDASSIDCFLPSLCLLTAFWLSDAAWINASVCGVPAAIAQDSTASFCCKGAPLICRLPCAQAPRICVLSFPGLLSAVRRMQTRN